MIRATTATWLNYATTLVFQILFAARFGSSEPAGAFVIAFALAASLGGVFVSTAMSVVLPRMLVGQEAISRPAVRRLWLLGGLSILLAAAVVAGAPALAYLIAPVVGVDPAFMASLLALAAVFLGTLSLSGLVGTLALIRGRRFVPALAPAIPSTLAAILLMASPGSTVFGVFVAICVGGLFQLALVTVVAVWPRPQFADAPPPPMGIVAVSTAGLLLLLGLLPALQRVIAATIDPSGAAQFDYAARGIQVAQQLLIGGLLIAVLPEWSARHSQTADIRRDFRNRLVAATLLLFSAGAIALVAAPQIAAIVFQRGAFGPADTAAVGQITRIMVPGFVAEGMALVVVQAMLSVGRADRVVRLGVARLVAQVVLTIALGLAWGAHGVAAAYSLSLLIAVVVAVLLASDVGVFDSGSPELRRSLQAGSITGAAAVLLMLAGEFIPPLLSAFAVGAVSMVAARALHLSDAFIAAIRGAGDKQRV